MNKNPKNFHKSGSLTQSGLKRGTAAATHINGASSQEAGSAIALEPSVPATGKLDSICVYCGSGPGANPAYVEAARELGRSLATEGVRLVYGGGGMGLMGQVAMATLEGGGRVTGIIPSFLTEKEHMLTDVDELLVTDDMHTRKRLMFENSDAFVALPGGIGTLEELVEQLTWSQLGRHKKPIVVANIAGFWNPFLSLLAHMRDDHFIRNGINVRFIVVESASAIIPAIRAALVSDETTVPDRAITARF